MCPPHGVFAMRAVSGSPATLMGHKILLASDGWVLCCLSCCAPYGWGLLLLMSLVLGDSGGRSSSWTCLVRLLQCRRHRVVLLESNTSLWHLVVPLQDSAAEHCRLQSELPSLTQDDRTAREAPRRLCGKTFPGAGILARVVSDVRVVHSVAKPAGRWRQLYAPCLQRC